MTSRKALFVINPISGGKSKTQLPDMIHAALQNKIDYKIIYWQSAEEDIESIIKNEITENNFTILVAAGGDGTINKMAGCIKETKTALGILPFGSGNGFSRFLKIPMNTTEALNIIATGREVYIDTCSINNRSFFCTAGVGFDAYIGKLFNEGGKRGPWTYIKKITKEFSKYTAIDYEIIIDGKKFQKNAFLITFANANQWGNEAQIAPEANIQDGLLNITVIKSFKVFQAPLLASRLYLKNIHKSQLVETFTGKEITVNRKSEGPAHFDGDPEIMGEKIEVRIFPSTLKVCVPQGSVLK